MQTSPLLLGENTRERKFDNKGHITFYSQNEAKI